MTILSILKAITGSPIIGAVERIGSEWIETNKENAEARALFIKTLDPNGKMRRDLSRFACRAYGFYLISMVGLSFMVAFNIGDAVGAETAANMMQSLFLPITSAWGAIVTASFGVNGMNSFKGV